LDGEEGSPVFIGLADALHASSAINLLAMTDTQNRDCPGRVVYFVDDSVIPGSHSPSRKVSELAAAGRPRVFSEGINFLFYGFVGIGIESSELAFRSWEDEKTVTHFRLCSMRAIASSNGTGISPDALAPS
jgi:hypothetical protein